MKCKTCVKYQAGADQIKEFHECLTKVHQFLRITQIPDNPPEYRKYYRQMNKVGTVRHTDSSI